MRNYKMGTFDWHALIVAFLSITSVVIGLYRALGNKSFLNFIIVFLIPFYGLFYFFIAKKKVNARKFIPDNLNDDV